jgi:glycosidase
VRRILSRWPVAAFAACGGDGPPAEPEPVAWCEEDFAPYPEVAESPGLIYEIYVRSFQDSDGDGVGDLAGVRSRLDYLQSLGVGALWLTPVFESPSVHGYDPTSLTRVRAEFGGDDALDALVDEARARGLRVVLDVPVNHTSSQHPWFLSATEEPDSPTRGHYVFGDEQYDEYRWFEAEDGSWYYAFFGESLPDVDWTNAELAADMLAAIDEVAVRADGMRLDAVAQLVEEDGDISGTDSTHCLLQGLVARARQANPELVVLSEAWADTPSELDDYLGPDGAPETDVLLDTMRMPNTLSAFTTGDVSAVRTGLSDHVQGGTASRMLAYSEGHDTDRLIDRLPSHEARRAFEVANFLLPGTPVLFYGEEIELRDSPDVSGQDAPQRGPMAWDDGLNAGFTDGEPWFPVDQRYLEGYNVASALGDPASMVSLILALSSLRGALEGAEVEMLTRVDTPLLIARYTRGAAALLVAINVDDETVTTDLALDAGMLELTGEGSTVAATGDQEVSFAAYQYRVWALGLDGPTLP